MLIQIADILVDEDIMTTTFACDLGACRGACCTMPGGRGAPVADNEVEPLLDSVEPSMKWLADGKKRLILRDGPLEGRRGDYATRCVEDQDCVFVYYEDSVAKCAIERAWLEGETSFRKPLSCHLFPIRVDELFSGDRLRYEEISECADARTRGDREKILLLDFLEEPIVRAYGREFYDQLKGYQESLKDEKE